MSDTTTDPADQGFAPVPLLANSYDLHELEAAAAHAQGLKTEEGRADAFASLATKSALRQDVIEGFANPAVPEGSELAEVEDAQGRIVTAPVSIPAAEEAEPESTKSTTRTTRRSPADSSTDQATS